MTAQQDTDLLPAAEGTAGSWLDGAPAALGLPTDRPRPTSLSGSTEHLEVGVPLAPLQALAERLGTGLDAVVLGALAVYLARTTDETDVVLGTGAGDDVLVARVGLDLQEGTAGCVQRAARALQEARDRGARSVPGWVQELGLEPGTNRHPVFQVALVEGPAASWPGSWGVPPDLVLGHRVEDGELRLDLQWAPELFDRLRVERAAGHLARLLSGGADDAGAPVGLLPLLGPDELAELDGWNATEHPHDPTAPLAERFWAQADATPDAPAVEHDGQPVSYRELGERAQRVARLLRARGVGSGVAVAVCAERSVDMLVGVLATLMAGGGYVPVDPAYPADRRELMLSGSGARVLLTQSALAGLAAETDVEVLLLDALPDEEPDAAAGERLRGGSGADLGYVVFTSGSTGRPKAVAMSQAALDNMIAWQLRRPQFVPGRRTLQFSALSFDVSFEETFSTWASGGTLVLVDEATRRDPARLLEHLLAHRVERIFLPYVALRGLAAAAAASGRYPTALREVYTAGEQLQVDPVLRALFAALPGAVLENQYGPSESHVVTAHTLPADPAAWPPLPSIGGPVDNSEVHVLDARLQRVPVGVPGELYLGGRCLADGYLGQPELTAERFVPAPEGLGRSPRLYKTGDLARWTRSGELEFLGRRDDQVKFRGYRIEPGEVAAVLSGGPGVGQCVALVRTVGGGPRLTAYLVPDGAREPDLAEVHRFAKDHLPGYMVPSHYLVVPSLPLTSSGKIDTRALPDAPFDRGILTTPYQAPSSHEERVLAGIWSQLLGVPDVGVHDDFFELGGDSLLAAEMVQRVAEELGREMPLGALAQAPTVGGLAALLTAQDDSGLARSLVPLRPGTEGTTPLFVVHGGSGNVATFPKLARALPLAQPVYALQWDGFAGRRGSSTVGAMAEHYLAEIRTVQPQGPYLLAGQCIGGLVAHEMTRRLLARGEQVRLLVMYDSPNLASEAYVPPDRPPLARRLASVQGARTAAYEAARAVYRRLPTRDPVRRGARAMRRAAWQHRPAPLPQPVPTHFVGSGESSGSAIALEGHWTDGAMGWGSSESEHFAVHRLQGEHNTVLYDPEALDVLRRALRRAHEEIAAG